VSHPEVAQKENKYGGRKKNCSPSGSLRPPSILGLECHWNMKSKSRHSCVSFHGEKKELGAQALGRKNQIGDRYPPKGRRREETLQRNPRGQLS